MERLCSMGYLFCLKVSLKRIFFWATSINMYVLSDTLINRHSDNQWIIIMAFSRPLSWHMITDECSQIGKHLAFTTKSTLIQWPKPSVAHRYYVDNDRKNVVDWFSSVTKVIGKHSSAKVIFDGKFFTHRVPSSRQRFPSVTITDGLSNISNDRRE